MTTVAAEAEAWSRRLRVGGRIHRARMGIRDRRRLAGARVPGLDVRLRPRRVRIPAGRTDGARSVRVRFVPDWVGAREPDGLDRRCGSRRALDGRPRHNGSRPPAPTARGSATGRCASAATRPGDKGLHAPTGTPAGVAVRPRADGSAVDTAFGSNFDSMVYLPSGRYPAVGWGGAVVPVGKWAYVWE